ncbi:MAG: hypothetical protein KatS3mg091_397 [Patescibacteria group bacterium]|nr:MAG: hypothetical protein KatS3mg091_397 [Patescibacteria group bacterium]
MQAKKIITSTLNLSNKELPIWEKAIKIFNNQFARQNYYLTFRQNKHFLINKTINNLVFIAKKDITYKLTSEKKRSIYFLNIIYELERLKETNKKTLIIIDDIANYYNYKNKYAIVDYLRQLSTNKNFNFIIMTANFDFFRTLITRGVASYRQCLFAQKTTEGINLIKAYKTRNPFLQWKNHLTDNKKLIASIAFVRNLIEFSEAVKTKTLLN